jgi:hypothetical protein
MIARLLFCGKIGSFVYLYVGGACKAKYWISPPKAGINNQKPVSVRCLLLFEVVHPILSTNAIIFDQVQNPTPPQTIKFIQKI